MLEDYGYNLIITYDKKNQQFPSYWQYMKFKKIQKEEEEMQKIVNN
jgi:hypothetical protein